VIKDAESRKLLERYHLFGDIVTCKVIGFEQRKSQLITILYFTSQ